MTSASSSAVTTSHIELQDTAPRLSRQKPGTNAQDFVELLGDWLIGTLCQRTRWQPGPFGAVRH
jgi:hypothetical protein